MEVILYSNGCPRCCVLQQKLDTKHITYAVENSVDKMLAMGINQVPVLSVDGELLAFGQANEWINKQ